MELDPSLLGLLACPRDRTLLENRGQTLRCHQGHEYPVVNGIPVMLVEEAEQTLPVQVQASLELSRRWTPQETLAPEVPGEVVDPFVQNEIMKTNGILYKHLIKRVKRYPIPEIRLAESDGDRLLDIGCNWGRWVAAAARKGYRPVGLDPKLEALLAAQRVMKQLGVEAHFVAGDARFLPFADHVFDQVFSYSVLQHFAKDNVRQTLREINRVLRPGGRVTIQMPNLFGARQFFNYARRGFRTSGFQVRYWTVPELRRTFSEAIGPTTTDVDGYFSLNPQTSDLDLLPGHARAVVHTSYALTRLSRKLPVMRYIADSIYVWSEKHSRP